MFGAFTHDEVVALTAWIDSVEPGNNDWLKWGFTCREPLNSKKAVGELQDPARHHPLVRSSGTDKIALGSLTAGSQEPVSDSELQIKQQPLIPPSNAQLSDAIALWVAHISLLE